MAEAESVATQWSPDPYQRFVDLAWRRIVECTAHDSVTGCGVDETAAQVAARLAEATQAGPSATGLSGRWPAGRRQGRWSW